LNVAHVSFADLCGPLDYHLVIPALFLWLEKVCFLAFGMTEWGMRLPAFIAGCCALAAMVPISRRIVCGLQWWLPVAFFALSRHAIGHGAEVRPYTVDLLCSIVILWATAVILGESATRLRGIVVLVVLAAVGPWLSFPAAFGLAGACAALFVAAWQAGGRTRWAIFATVSLVSAVSALALWDVQARHLYYSGMNEHWGPAGWGGFPDYSRPWSAVLWPISRSVEAGNYGTREMGLVLSGLALIGAVSLMRRRAALATALVLPFATALIASYLGKYPLAHRTTTFLLPILWLAAAIGVQALVAHLPGRWIVVVLLLALLGTDLVNAFKDAVRATPITTRAAFADVQAARLNGDAVWVGHVEVYQTYYGPEHDVLGASNHPAEVIAAARSGRIWVVVNPSPFRAPIDDLTDALSAAGYREAERHSYHGVVVGLYTH
jgi:hypothetical protein